MRKTNSNIPTSDPLLTALTAVPEKFRSRIAKEYTDLKRRFYQSQHSRDFDGAGLSAGKFCETVLRFLQQHLTGSSIAFGKHIPNFPDECRKLIALQSAEPESLRIIIPRALVFLYTLRGKRGIGHVGGDVDANLIDIATITRVTDWVLCELIRVFHKLSLEEAQGLVDSLSTKQLPEVWEIGGKKRILTKGLTVKEQVLVFAYADVSGGVLLEDVLDWIEYSNPSMFKTSVVEKLHAERLIEYNKDLEAIFISPLGMQSVEKRLAKSDQNGA